jgi:hypothetical protein
MLVPPIGINKSQPTNCDEDNDKDNGKNNLVLCFLPTQPYGIVSYL